MLTSPITVTIDGVAHSLVRTNNDNFTSVYRKATTGLELLLNIRHSYEGKAGQKQYERHNVELIRTTWDVNGLPIVQNAFTTIRFLRGSDATIATKDATGLYAFVNSNLAALVAWE